MSGKALVKEIRVSPDHYLGRSLEFINIILFDSTLGKSDLKVLEFFIKKGGIINSQTRKEARKHFGYSSANLSNYIRELKKTRCVDHVAGSRYNVRSSLMALGKSRQDYLISILVDED